MTKTFWIWIYLEETKQIQQKNKNKPQESNQQEPQTHPPKKSAADLQGGSQNVLIPRSVWNVVNTVQELGFFAALPHLVVESAK